MFASSWMGHGSSIQIHWAAHLEPVPKPLVYVCPLDTQEQEFAKLDPALFQKLVPCWVTRSDQRSSKACGDSKVVARKKGAAPPASDPS